MGRIKTIDDEELLAAARRAFREQGHAASTRDIARAAGISQAVLYQRFGSKEDLFFQAMTPEAPDLDVLMGTYPPSDAVDDLVAIGERLADFFREFMPTFFKVVSHPLADGGRLRDWHGRLPFTPIMHALMARIARLAADGFVADVPTEAAAFAILSASHSTAMFETFAATHEREERNPTVRAAVELLFQGLAPRSPVAVDDAKRSRSKK